MTLVVAVGAYDWLCGLFAKGVAIFTIARALGQIAGALVIALINK